LSAERNADGYRLQCLARALVRVALFVIALRKRLALVDGDAARDHPPLIGNGLRDPIADETLAGLVLSGHAIAASSGLGLIMLVAIPVGLAGLLPYERLLLLGVGESHAGLLVRPAALCTQLRVLNGPCKVTAHEASLRHLRPVCQRSSVRRGVVVLSRALINSVRLDSLAWNPASVSFPRNNSYRNQSRYVLITSLLQ